MFLAEIFHKNGTMVQRSHYIEVLIYQSDGIYKSDSKQGQWMLQIMQDITQNFIERINRLEVLFNQDADKCRVVTFDQSIIMKQWRQTPIAEDFHDASHIGHPRRGMPVYLQPIGAQQPSDYIKGALSADQVLILLVLPPGGRMLARHLAWDINLQSLAVPAGVLANFPVDLLYEERRACLYRIEGNVWVEGLLTKRDAHPGIAFLDVDWENKLRAMLREQVAIN